MGTLRLASSTFSRNNNTLQRTRAWLWAHHIFLSLGKDIIRSPHLYLIRVVCHHGLITYVSNGKNMRRVGSPFGSNIQFRMLSVRKMKTLSVSLNNFLLHCQSSVLLSDQHTACWVYQQRSFLSCYCTHYTVNPYVLSTVRTAKKDEGQFYVVSALTWNSNYYNKI